MHPLKQAITHLLENEIQGHSNSQRRRQGKTNKLQKALQLRRIVGHHVDYLTRARYGPTGGRHTERFAVEHGGNGGADKDGRVGHDYRVSSL